MFPPQSISSYALAGGHGVLYSRKIDFYGVLYSGKIVSLILFLFLDVLLFLPGSFLFFFLNKITLFRIFFYFRGLPHRL